MTGRPPEFHEFVGPEVPPDERERLLDAHEALIEAGPRPELPPWLEQPPSPWLLELEQRRRKRPRRVAFALAAALAGLAFFVGYIVGNSGGGGGFSAAGVVKMHGTSAAPQATASLLVGHQQSAGNWPMMLRVSGLQPLRRGYYELYLTRGTRKIVSCGTFEVERGRTSVQLNAPYLVKHAGWIIVRSERGKPSETLLTT